MTLRQILTSDPLILIYVVAATTFATIVVVQLLQLAWFHLRIWNINRVCEREHRKWRRMQDRRRQDACGETLVDEIRIQFDGLPPIARRR